MATIVQLWSDVKCAGGVQVYNALDYVDVQWTQQIGGNRGGCSLVLRANDPACAYAAIMNVIRIIDDQDDGTTPEVFEYRISELNDGAQLGVVTITGMDIIMDLGRNRMRALVGGVAQYGGAGTLTIAQVCAGYILPAAVDAGMAWWSFGASSSSDAYALSWNRITPLALAQMLEGAANLECWAHRNGDAGYQLMFGLRNDGTGTPLAEVGSNVIALSRQIIVNELFYNRATPVGNTANGEALPTHVGEHAWKHTVTASNVLTLANPLAGGAAPIGFDNQLDGLVAALSHDAMPFQHINTARSCIGYDSINARLGLAGLHDSWIGAGLAPGVIATVDIATGQQRVSATVADPSASEVFGFPTTSPAALVFAPNTGDWVVPVIDSAGTHVKVKFISAAGVVNATVITVSATTTTPTLFRYIPALDRVLICVDTVVTIINPNTRAIDGTYNPGAAMHSAAYSASANRLYFLANGGTSVFFCNSTNPFGGSGSFVKSASDTGLYGLLAVSGTTIYVASTLTATGASGVRTYDTGGSAWSATFNALPSYHGVAMNVTAGTGTQSDTLVHGLLPLLVGMSSGPGYALLDPANLTVAPSNPVMTLLNVAGLTTPLYVSSLDAWVYLSPGSLTAQFMFWNNGVLKPWQSFPVSATNVAAQTITKPGANVGIYASGGCVQFRADASETYLENLTNPASLATYGPVDGFPAFPLLAKRNYKRDGFLSEWDTNGEPRWVGVIDPLNYIGGGGTPAPATRSYRWQSADQASATSYAVVKDTTETFVTAALTTLKFKSLPANFVLQPGDCFYVGTSQMAFVRTRTVATGAGTVTVNVNLQRTSWADLTAVTLYAPRLTLNGLPAQSANALAMYTQDATIGGAAGPTFKFALPIPSVAGASLAWVMAKFAFYSYDSAGVDPVTITLRTPTAPNTAPATATTLATHAPIIGPVTTPAQFVLAAPITLSTIGTFNGDPQYWTAQVDCTMGKFVCYLLSLEVVVATAVTDLVAKNLVDGGDGNVMWLLTNEVLALKGTPAINYKIEYIEKTRGYIGQSLRLKDVARGISTTTARTLVLTRRGVRKGQSRNPTLTLNNQDQYIATELVALETA